MAHTIIKQKVYYNKKGNPVRSENVGSDTCTCPSDGDHTQTVETEVID